MIRCSECKQLVPADEFAYGVDGDCHIELVQVAEEEQEQRLCGPAEREGVQPVMDAFKRIDDEDPQGKPPFTANSPTPTERGTE